MAAMPQVMRGIEPFLAQALEKIEQLKDQQAVRSRALEATIEGHRDDTRRIAAEDADVSGSHVASRQGEPIQMTGGLNACRRLPRVALQARASACPANMCAWSAARAPLEGLRLLCRYRDFCLGGPETLGK